MLALNTIFPPFFNRFYSLQLQKSAFGIIKKEGFEIISQSLL
jgi:hypothetical protein